jgi:anti-sigma factor RsiW
MKTTQQLLDIQAYVDGELEPRRRAEVEQWLARDDEARELQRELAGTRALLRSAEPVASVPETREFYWSGISRRIAAADKADERAEATAHASPLRLLRWLVPALGLGAVALVLTFQHPVETASLTPNFETSHSDTTTITFRSESDGMTIHWVN